MNYLDYFILIVVIYFVSKGAYKGLIQELFALASIIISITACYLFGKPLVLWVEHYWVSPWVEPTTYLILFSSLYLIIKLIAKALTKFIKIISLSTINRILGAGFGATKALLIVLTANYAYQHTQQAFGLKEPKIITESSFYPVIQDVTEYFITAFSLQ